MQNIPDDTERERDRELLPTKLAFVSIFNLYLRGFMVQCVNWVQVFNAAKEANLDRNRHSKTRDFLKDFFKPKVTEATAAIQV